MSSRPSIPSKIKREVRKRCGFGCVICGLPIYEYDHLPGFANVKRHKESELTLLCPNHHAMKTKRLLSNIQVEEANSAPINHRRGNSSPFTLMFSGDSPKIMISGLTFQCTETYKPRFLIPIMLNKRALFGFTIVDGGLLLNMDVRDAKGKKVLRIKDSELEVSSSAWDATIVGNKIIIKEGLRDSIVELELCPPGKFIINKYRIESGGVTVSIDKSTISFRGEKIVSMNLMGDGIYDANVCILSGDAPRNMSVALKLGEVC